MQKKFYLQKDGYTGTTGSGKRFDTTKEVFSLKNGLFYENDELIYYKDGEPEHAGVIRVDGAIYYISSKGRAVRGEHIVHGEMSNGILKRGTYTFGEDYKLVKGSYIAPSKSKKKPVKRKRNPKKESFWDPLKKMKHKPLLIGALLVAVLLAGVVWAVEGTGGGPMAQTPTDINITLPQFTEDVLLCSQAAKKEYDGELSLKMAIQTGSPYRAFVFEYSLPYCSGTMLVSEDAEFSNATEYNLPEGQQGVAIHNLKVDTTYYYKVLVNGQEYLGTFHTALSTRFVQIPGVVNTRDIGGGTTQDGKRVKQGLLIRGVELDGLVRPEYFVPTEEIQYVKDTFGFVYDMDLRAETVCNGPYTSRLGIDHKFYAAPYYGLIFNINYQPALKQIFSDLADAQKYPMYLHCTWGQDRTGTIIFLLQGLLNMSEEEMMREYRLTAYENPEIADNLKMDVVISGLQPYEGDTLQEKIVTFLTQEIGVTETEITSIRSIFLEDAQ